MGSEEYVGRVGALAVAPGRGGTAANELTLRSIQCRLSMNGSHPSSPAVGPNGTVYVTTVTSDGFTIVRTIAPPIAV